MNPIPHRSHARIAVVLLLLPLLGACSTVESRIKERPQDFAALSASDQALVLRGRIRNDMTPASVYLAWGSPDAVTAGQVRGRETETWLYHATRTYSVPAPFFLTGWYGRWSYCDPLYPPPTTTVVEQYLRAWAAFQNGRVTSWQAAF